MGIRFPIKVRYASRNILSASMGLVGSYFRPPMYAKVSLKVYTVLMVSTRNARRVLLSVSSRVFCNLDTKLLGHTLEATKAGQRRKTMRCRNCCTCPRGAQRNRIDCPGAQSMRKGRMGNYSTGCLAKYRIFGEKGRPNIRCPATQAKILPKRRIHQDAHKSDGMSHRGRNAPLLQSQLDTCPL